MPDVPHTFSDLSSRQPWLVGVRTLVLTSRVRALTQRGTGASVWSRSQGWAELGLEVILFPS